MAGKLKVISRGCFAPNKAPPTPPLLACCLIYNIPATLMKTSAPKSDRDQSINQSINPSIHQSINLSIKLSIYLSIYLSSTWIVSEGPEKPISFLATILKYMYT